MSDDATLVGLTRMVERIDQELEDTSRILGMVCQHTGFRFPGMPNMPAGRMAKLRDLLGWDELPSVPRFVGTDDPEPPVGSVVVDQGNCCAFLRTNTGWVSGSFRLEDTRSTWGELLQLAPLTLIHEGVTSG